MTDADHGRRRRVAADAVYRVVAARSHAGAYRQRRRNGVLHCRGAGEDVLLEAFMDLSES